jgi:hypothetical protein
MARKRPPLPEIVELARLVEVPRQDLAPGFERRPPQDFSRSEE